MMLSDLIADRTERPSGTRRVVAKVEWHPGEQYARDGFTVTHLARPAERVETFYNHRGMAEQRIKEGKARSNGRGWLACRSFAANAVRLQAPRTGLQPQQFRAAMAIARNGRAVAANQPAREVDQDRRQGGEPRPLRQFPLAEGAVSRQMFKHIQMLTARLRAPPAPA
jgi:hypothetical protein